MFLPIFKIINPVKAGMVVFVLFVQTMKTQIQDCCAHTESLALKTIKGIQVVRSFKAEKLELRRYSEAVLQMRQLRVRQELYGNIYGFVRRVSWLIDGPLLV